jgi:sensor histidine kinase YesM
MGFFSAIPIVVMALMVAIVLVYNNYIAEEHEKILDNLYFLKEVSVNFNDFNSDLEIYLAQTYVEDKDKSVDLNRIKTISDKVNTYAREIYYSKDWAKVKGLAGMLETYKSNTNSILEKMQKEEPYYIALTYNRDVAVYINTRLDTIVSSYLRDSSILFEQINRSSENLRLIIIISICLLSIMLLYFVYRFSKNVSRPIIQLSKNAEAVAGGTLDVTPVMVKSKDEVYVLAKSFNEMVMEIKQLIKKIVDQSELEHRLKEEEMKNLKSINLLKEAEIKMLQSQIDPHFLFNTLNIISRTSMLENAEMTGKLIQTTAKLMRYNMEARKKKEILLRDEIQNIEEYLYIYKTRFPEKFQYRVNTDDELSDVHVPYLFLQPLVENAIIHGLEPMAGKGMLNIRVFKQKVNGEEFAIVEIEDNGLGMEKEKMKKVLSGKYEMGTGINNVKKRLEYFYKRDVFSLMRNEPKGIRIRIQLPIEIVRDFD